MKEVVEQQNLHSQYSSLWYVKDDSFLSLADLAQISTTQRLKTGFIITSYADLLQKSLSKVRITYRVYEYHPGVFIDSISNVI